MQIIDIKDVYDTATVLDSFTVDDIMNNMFGDKNTVSLMGYRMLVIFHLERLCNKGLLRSIPRFGEATEYRIVRDDDKRIGEIE
jgi:hypothetical protein